MRRRDLIKAAAGAAALTVSKSPVVAQSAWPQKDRTIKVIVPWPPGAANDMLGRLLAERLQDKFGVNTVVENRTGSSGLVGTKAVIQSDPDGYTFLASAFNTAVMPLVLKSQTSIRKQIWTCLRARRSLRLSVSSLQAAQKTLAEVVAAAKADPKKWNFAISSLGSAAIWQRSSSCAAPAGTSTGALSWHTAGTHDLMGGSVQLLIDPSFALLPPAKDGTKVRALGIATKERSVLAPDVPTMAEAGLPGYEFNSWYGVWAPKGLPVISQRRSTAYARHDARSRNRVEAPRHAHRAGRRKHRRYEGVHSQRNPSRQRPVEKRQLPA